MPSKAATARIGAKGVVAITRRPTLRRMTVRVGTPPAKLVGKVIVRRKARGQIERLVAAGRTVGALAVVYGPMTAEVFGLVEPPKPKRRAPAFVAGVAIGAGAVYVLSRNGRD
jgi:hypothetical protein